MEKSSDFSATLSFWKTLEKTVGSLVSYVTEDTRGKKVKTLEQHVSMDSSISYLSVVGDSSREDERDLKESCIEEDQMLKIPIDEDTPLSAGNSIESFDSMFQIESQEDEIEEQDILESSFSIFESKHRDHRDGAIAELLRTEEKYVADLDTLIRLFVSPISSNIALKVSKSQCSRIFSNIEIIASFHKKLLSEFQRDPKNPPSALLRYADFLKLYTQYLKSYEGSITTLNALRNNAALQSFLQTQQKLPECRGQDLASFLIMPVQRVPRYEILLSEIIKHSHRTSQEFKSSLDAFEKVKETAAHINESQRKFETLSKLLEIQNKSADEHVSIVQTDRLLIREREIMLLKKTGNLLRRRNAMKRRILLLFNDCIMMTKLDHTFTLMVSLGGITVRRVSIDDRPGFCITSPKKCLTVISRSQEECDNWVDLISEQKEEYKQQRNMQWTLRKTRDFSIKSSLTSTIPSVEPMSLPSMKRTMDLVRKDLEQMKASSEWGKNKISGRIHKNSKWGKGLGNE